jgi:hypothetical protein
MFISVRVLFALARLRALRFNDFKEFLHLSALYRAEFPAVPL